MIYAYTRVSTKQQVEKYGLETQKQEILSKYPDAIVYEEQYTGTKVDRPIFNELINKLQPNDLLVVSKLDRFARNTVEGIKVVEKLFSKKVSIHILNIGLLEDTPMGRFFLTTIGKEIARQNPDYKEGRPKKYSDEELFEAIYLLKSYSYSNVVKMTGISKSTLIRTKKLYK